MIVESEYSPCGADSVSVTNVIENLWYLLVTGCLNSLRGEMSINNSNAFLSLFFAPCDNVPNL